MKLSNEWYDILKYLGTIFLPAFAVFYQNLADIWPLPYSEQIPPTILAIVVLLNTSLQISSANYYKNLADESSATNVVDVEDIEHSVGAENGDSDKG